MFEIHSIKKSKSARGLDKYQFAVRFILTNHLGSVNTTGWSYFPHKDQLFTPQIPGGFVKSSVATPEIHEAIKEQIKRFILYQGQNIDKIGRASCRERGED